MKKVLNVMKYSYFTVVVILTLWVLASWLDVITHNCLGCANYAQYADWNLFFRLFGM